MTRHEAGFTLIETLVALFVIAMLATAGGMLLLQTVGASAQVEARTGELTEMQVTHALLLDDMANMRTRVAVSPNPFSQDRGFVGERGDRDGMVLRFVRGGWSNPLGRADRSDLQYVEYHLEDGTLSRLAWLRPDAGPETPVAERILAAGASSVSLRYYAAGVWREDWNTPAGGPREGFPEAIEITFAYSDTDTLTQTFLSGARS